MNVPLYRKYSLSLLLLPSLLIACSSESKVRFDNSRVVSMNIDARRHYNEGVRYGREGGTDPAIEAYTRSIEIDPGAGAYNNRSVEYLKKGRYDLALSDANSAIFMNGKYAAAYYNRGNAFYRMNKFKSAVKSYERAIRYDPSQAEFYYNCGLAYYRLDKTDESAAMYEKAVAADPACSAAHYNLACIHARRNEPLKALESLERAVDAGFSDADRLKSDDSFKKIRNSARFRALVRRMAKKPKR